MGSQKDRQSRITFKALALLILALFTLSTIRYGAMQLYGEGEGIEELHR